MLVFINSPFISPSKVIFRRSSPYLCKFCNKPKPFCTNTGKKQTFYEVLGVRREATPQEIKSAYYSLSKQFHPDSMSKDHDFNEAAIKFLQVGEAYEILGSKEKRLDYDRQLIFSNEGLSGSGYSVGRTDDDISRDLHNYEDFRTRWRKGRPAQSQQQRNRFDSRFMKEYKFDQKDFDKFYELYKKRQKEEDSESNWERQAQMEAQRLDSSEERAQKRRETYEQWYREHYHENENQSHNVTVSIIVSCLTLSSGILIYIYYQSY